MEKILKVKADIQEEKQMQAAVKTVHYSVISEQASDTIENMLVDLEENGFGGLK